MDAPLTGKLILVTRAASQSEQFCRLLQEVGAQVMEVPALEVTAPSTWVPLDQALGQLPLFSWLVVTSANGVEFFFQRLRFLGIDNQSLAGLKVAAVGEETARRVAQQGVNVDFVPREFVADTLGEEFPGPLEGQLVLFPRVETGGREALSQTLQERGALVREVPAYQSRCVPELSPAALTALNAHQVDVITFASAKTVRCFRQQLGGTLNLLQGVKIASIGPQTSAACQQLLGRVDMEASPYTFAGLTQAIVEKF